MGPLELLVNNTFLIAKNFPNTAIWPHNGICTASRRNSYLRQRESLRVRRERTRIRYCC